MNFNAVAVTTLGLLVFLASLTACNNDGDANPEAPENGLKASTPQAAISAAPIEDPTSSIVFPRHDAPLGTDNGGEYFAGQLVVSNGCLQAEAPSYDATNPRLSRLPIWPGTFTLEAEPGSVRIIDGSGRIAAHVGDHVRLSRATMDYRQAVDQGRVNGLSEDCAGPYFLVGDEVTAFDPGNEATELRLSEPEVVLLRRETVLGFPVLPQALGIGQLVLEDQCLRLDKSTTIVWPAGFTPHVHHGAVQVRNGSGQVIATVGDEIAAGGAYHSLESGACSGPVFSANQIKVLPDVEVYFPRQDGTMTAHQQAERFAGELVLEGKCLQSRSTLRVRDRALMPVDPLLIWPGTFSVSMDDGYVGILDSTGRLVARVGDEVQFSAIDLTHQQAMEHGGLEEISPACSGPYWAVGEDFSVLVDQAP